LDEYQKKEYLATLSEKELGELLKRVLPMVIENKVEDDLGEEYFDYIEKYEASLFVST